MSRKNDARLRLYSLKERNALDAERRASMRGRFSALATRHEDGTAPQAVSSFNLFPTPPAIARLMVERADFHAGHRILEPSCGTGRLLDALPADVTCVAVEISIPLQKHIFTHYPNVSLKGGDFLTRTTADLGGQFDRVLMNPPFQRGTDIKHILHAQRMLTKDGVLVALCYNGSIQQRKLQPLTSSWEVLPDNSFGSEGTHASVALITMHAVLANDSP